MSLTLGYVVPEFPSQTHAFFWREVAALRGLGVEVFLISTRRPPDGACRHAFADDAQRQTHYLFPPRWFQVLWCLLRQPHRMARAIVYVLTLPESTIAQRAALLGLILPAAELCNYANARNIGHVHVHSCANAAHVARIAKFLGGPKFSLTLHGDLSVYGTDHAQKATAAEFVACVTRPLQEQVRQVTGLPPKKIPLLWMGVDTQQFQVPHGRSVNANQLCLLTVARLNYTKGHRFALRALKKVIDQGINVTYLMAGEGPERANIEKEIVDLGLSSHARLLGTQSEDEVLRHLQRADALLLTSIGAGEAAPVSVMEAMSCGLPVVCSIIGGTPDMIADGVTGFLVQQEDVDALAEKILLLGRDVSLRQKMGNAARQKAVEEFDSIALANRFLEILHSKS